MRTGPTSTAADHPCARVSVHMVAMVACSVCMSPPWSKDPSFLARALNDHLATDPQMLACQRHAVCRPTLI